MTRLLHKICAACDQEYTTKCDDSRIGPCCRIGAHARKSYRMFAAELDGDLVLLHMSSRAGEVRTGIARMLLADWEYARKIGWRVVPVVVAHATVKRRPRRLPAGPSAAQCALTRAWDQVG